MHLCKLLLRHSKIYKNRNSSALCTCASCFSQARRDALAAIRPSALCTCASCFQKKFEKNRYFFLLLCALVQVASLLFIHTLTRALTSALCTCASCFGKTAQFFASGSRSNLHRCAVTYHI